VDESGSGYATAPTVTILPAITGRGSGATATAILNNAGGVERFVLTNSGSGYTAKNYPITAQGVSFYTIFLHFIRSCCYQIVYS
jgi:hypothetical protein